MTSARRRSSRINHCCEMTFQQSDCKNVSLPRRSPRLSMDSTTSPFIGSPAVPCKQPKYPQTERKRGRPRKFSIPQSPNSTAKSSPVMSRSRKRQRICSDEEEMPSMQSSVIQNCPTRKSARVRCKRPLFENMLGGQNGAKVTVTEHASNESICSSEHIVEVKWRERILMDLQRKVRRKADLYGYFSRPVDPEHDECLDYYDVVDRKETMCFDTMEEMIALGNISDIDQYVECLGKIVKAARKYNTDEENFVRKQADLIEERSEDFIETARQKWDEKLKKEQGKEDKTKRREKRGRPCLSRKKRTVLQTEETHIRRRPRRQKGRRVSYKEDEESMISSSSSESCPSKDAEHDGGGESSIDGSLIPHCNRMLSGSVMAACNIRSEWLQLCPQLATVCNEAARRSKLRSDPRAEFYEKPLSVSYIKERIEYDDPLEGFIVRTESEPKYIQGFILTTKFTTWKKTFRWTIEEPAALITPADHRLHMTDKYGELTNELKNCERDESNPSQGYSYNRICEISLLGGLGCGSALLSRALSELRQSDMYDYVVLQATKIAIPFYEKHGFVRVGAVMRFNDIETLPEVAYRHWSEIVNGVAVEPSYMMGRRLKLCHGNDNTSPVTTRTDEEVEKDIVQALKCAHSLLSDAITVRIGSIANVNTFREMLSSAREYAISVYDYNLVELIDKAQAEFTGSHLGKSKRLLRREVRCILPIGNGQQSSKKLGKVSRNNSSFCDISDEQSSRRNTDTSNQKALVVATINFGEHSCMFKPLEVSLPVDFMSSDELFHVEVKLDGEVYWQRFRAAKLSRSLKPTFDLVKASELAVENLESFICKRRHSKKLKDAQVAIGDEIMLKVDAYDGMPLWVDATVKRRTKFPESKVYYTGFNAFLVEWDDEGKCRQAKRVLDIRNRGVGKDWCTAIDWSSFPVLPTKILDSLLVGSKVKYPSADGKIVDGVVIERIGGGLQNEPTYRIKTKLGERDICAGAIREAVTINDANILQTKKLLTNKSFTEKNSGPLEDYLDDELGLKESNVDHAVRILSSENWAKSRMQRFNLTNIHEKDKANLKNMLKNDDDFIVHLSTGITNTSDSQSEVCKGLEEDQASPPKVNHDHDHDQSISVSSKQIGRRSTTTSVMQGHIDPNPQISHSPTQIRRSTRIRCKDSSVT